MRIVFVKFLIGVLDTFGHLLLQSVVCDLGKDDG